MNRGLAMREIKLCEYQVKALDSIQNHDYLLDNPEEFLMSISK